MESLSLDQKRNYLRVFEQCFSHENEEKLTAEADIKGRPGEKTMKQLLENSTANDYGGDSFCDDISQFLRSIKKKEPFKSIFNGSSIELARGTRHCLMVKFIYGTVISFTNILDCYLIPTTSAVVPVHFFQEHQVILIISFLFLVWLHFNRKSGTFIKAFNPKIAF